MLHFDETDFILFDSIAKGDENSFRKFYEKYFPSIYSHVLKLFKGEPIAEEITQEIFVTLWMKRSQIFSKQNFSAYLYVIIQNKTVDFLRKLKREKILYEYIKERSESQCETINTKSESFDYLPLLHQAIEQLPNKRKTIFRLCKFENKSYNEISVMLRLSKHTINDHIVKANQFLKEYFLDDPQGRKKATN